MFQKKGRGNINKKKKEGGGGGGGGDDTFSSIVGFIAESILMFSNDTNCNFFGDAIFKL